MPFRWTLNPYMGCVHRCSYCYVRAYEKRADRPFDSRYGTSIRVKTNVAQVLRWELHRRSWRRETVAIGAATDPYQPAEGRYRLTRQCLEVLTAAHNPFGLITRGPMIVRDVDVLQEASRRAAVGINVSIPTLDPGRLAQDGAGYVAAASAAACGAAADRRRHQSEHLDGTDTARISDAPEQLATVVRAAYDAGASGVWANLLHLCPGTREHFLNQVARDWPTCYRAISELYRYDAYLPEQAKAPALSKVAELKRLYAPQARRANLIEPPPPVEQLSLLALVG